MGGPFQVFTEYFNQSAPGANWSIYSQVAGNSMRWQNPGEIAGFHYYNYGQGYAFAPWSVGSQPFDLKFDVQIVNGTWREWRREGVFVALSTAPPNQMTAGDISIVAAIQAAGPAGSVRQGLPFVKDTELSNISKWPTGGDVDSIAWPNTDLSGTRLSVEMQRRPDNVIQFDFYRPDYLGGTTPWWTGCWTIPSGLLKTSFNYLVVQTLNTATTATAPGYGYVQQGAVSNIRGYVIGSEVPPAASSVAPLTQNLFQGGTTVIISGQGFLPGAQVWIGNQYVPATYISPTQLSVTLPMLPMGTYHIKVINPSGLEAEIPAGITYSGPTLIRIEPREASPTGGDIVTVVGAGFDSSTKIQINGIPAFVMQVVDGFHLQVQVPAGTAGIATVTATGNGAAFTGSPSFGYSPHPYMHYTPSQLAGLRRNFLDPQFADYAQLVIRNATDSNPATPHGVVADYLWAYLFTGNAQYRASLFTKIAQELSRIDFTDFRLQDASFMASAYDALFPELTPQQRTDFLAYLDRAYGIYNNMRTNGAWFLGPSGGNVSNTVAVGNSSGGQVAVALQYSTPGASAVITDAVKRITPFAVQCIGSDGGDVEGPLYWNFGLTSYLVFGHVLRNALGTDYGLLTQANLQQNYHFVETTLAGDGFYTTFNDSEPQLYGMAITADFGSRYNQPLMLWMADYIAHRAVSLQLPEDEATRYDIAPFAFMWRGSTAAPTTFPGLPTNSLLRAMQWGILRSDGAQQPALVAGIKGATGTLTHHLHSDLGSFVLQSLGEGFFIDPGYYQPAAAKHSISVIDGVAPGTTGATIDSVMDDGVVRSMTVDSTKAYGGKVTRVRRTLVMYANKGVILLDDIVPGTGQPGIVTAQFQTGYPTQASTNGFTVQGLASSVSTTLNGPSATVITAGPIDFGNSWVFKSQNVHWYSVNATYTVNTAQPLVTVMTPNPSSGAGLTASVSYGSATVTVTFSDGQTIRFSQTSSGWTASSSAGTLSALPTLASVTPNSGMQGQSVAVTLTGTNFLPGASVSVSGAGVTVAGATVVSATQIAATLAIAASAAPGTYGISVTTSAGATSALPFTVTASPVPPSLTAVSPNSGVQGRSVAVTLTGTNFLPGITVGINAAGVSASGVSVVSATQITATLAIAANATPGTYGISVTTPAGTSSAVPFTVTASPVPPSLAAVSPSSGMQGQSVAVTLAGTNFLPGTAVGINAAGVSVSGVSVVSATQITATLAIAAGVAPGAYGIYVTTTAGASSALPFTVIASPVPPSLTAVSPNSGMQGKSVAVTLTGTNFLSYATVSVSGAGVSVSAVSVVSATQITATLGIAANAAPGAYSISVSTTAGTSNAASFTVVASGGVVNSTPTLTSMTPSSAARGTAVTVTLTGTNFTPGAGVRLAGAGAAQGNVTVVSSTQITATFTFSPSTATGAHNVYVVTSTGSSNILPFMVN